MAEVFLAHDEVLGRDVALKILRSQYAGDEEFAERFRREARSAAGLSHPNIVPVYDRGEAPDGTCYIAMEYVSGGTLKECLDERGPLEPLTALAVAEQVADALSAAHERGVIHRDIKPQNVLVTDTGDLKVTDFGIARAASAATISTTHAVFGTAGYLSPEQALGEPATPRSDLYSLGIVLYEMLTGVVPFRANNPVAVCMKHVSEAPVPPAKLDPAIPDSINALVVGLLAKDPAGRPESATALLDAIERAREGARESVRNGASATAPGNAAASAAPAQPPARPPGDAPPVGRRPVRGPGRRRPRALAAGALVALALVCAVALAAPRGQGQDRLDRVGGVSHAGLYAPTSHIIGAGGAGAGGGTTGVGSAGGGVGPAPAPTLGTPAPPASSPPAPPPPGGGSPGQSQYAGGG